MIEKMDLSKVVGCGIKKIDDLFDLNNRKGFEPGFIEICSEKQFNKLKIASMIANSLSDNVFYCDVVGYINRLIKHEYPDMTIIKINNINCLQKLINKIIEAKKTNDELKDEKVSIIVNFNNIMETELLDKKVYEVEEMRPVIVAKTITDFVKNNIILLKENNIFVFVLADIETKKVDLKNTKELLLPLFLRSNESIKQPHPLTYLCDTVFILSDTVFILRDYTELYLYKSKYSSKIGEKINM